MFLLIQTRWLSLSSLNFYSIVKDFLLTIQGVISLFPLFHISFMILLLNFLSRLLNTSKVLRGVPVLGRWCWAGRPAQLRGRSTLSLHCCSQVEGELVEIHIAGDGANLRAEPGNLVGEHAGGRDLDRVVPVVVVVAEGVREVQDGHLADLGRVLRNVEMRRFDRTLCHRVRHEEEIELAIDDLGLLDEARVDVGTLRRVVDKVLTVVTGSLLEESLSHTLVHNDQGDFRDGLSGGLRIASVLHGDDAIELLQLLVNDLLAHGVTDTVTVDEDVGGEASVVELAVGLEGAREVVRQDGGRDDLLALDRLRASLCVVLAHVGVVRGTEANRRLFTLVADVNAHKHGLLGDLRAEGHTPEVTTEFGIHLADDVEEDSVIILGNRAVGDELRDDWTVTVDLVLEEGVEVLVVRVVRHDNQEDEVRVLDRTT